MNHNASDLSINPVDTDPNNIDRLESALISALCDADAADVCMGIMRAIHDAEWQAIEEQDAPVVARCRGLRKLLVSALVAPPLGPLSNHA